jgi:hypothetical protein
MSLVAYDGRQFVAVGLDDERLSSWTSDDGLTWSAPRHLDDERGVIPQSLSFANGTTVIAGTVAGHPVVWRAGTSVHRDAIAWSSPGPDVRASVVASGQRIVALVTDGRSTKAWQR